MLLSLSHHFAGPTRLEKRTLDSLQGGHLHGYKSSYNPYKWPKTNGPLGLYPL